ncbi:MAG: TonB family protein [Candidatus Omnitrophica bacterium]|nr:TonB family protein [Candidatus Omnitrophota bacterium]
MVWPLYYARANFMPVTFLGPILENVEPQKEKEILKEPGEIIEGGQLSGEVEETKRAYIGCELQGKYPLPVDELSEKPVPQIKTESSRFKELSVAESMEEQFKRKVLFKPEMPEYPQWAKEIGGNFEVQLKFLVLPDGAVGTVEKITSSGYPELDEIGIRYIRRWKFIALPETAVYKEQWGVIRLFFKLK